MDYLTGVAAMLVGIGLMFIGLEFLSTRTRRRG